MVESIGTQDAANRDLEERYRALEEAYAAQHWSHVIRLGESLLASLKGNRGLAFELRPRTQVLIAHAYLYGLSDRDAAEDLYGAVISSRCDPALRQIAAEGLKACNEPLRARPQGPQAAEPTPAREALQPSPASEPSPPATDQGAAPWTAAWAAPQAGSAVAGPAARPAGERSAPAMPWLAEPTGTAQPALQPVPGQGGDAPWLSNGVTASAPAREEQQAKPVAESPTALTLAAETLIPDVIEEPELIEVHQADPALADPVELIIASPQPQLPAAATAASAIAAPTEKLEPLQPRRPAVELTPAVAETVAGSSALLLDPALIEGALQEQAQGAWQPDAAVQAAPDPLDQLDSLPSLGQVIDDPDADLARSLLRVVIR